MRRGLPSTRNRKHFELKDAAPQLSADAQLSAGAQLSAAPQLAADAQLAAGAVASPRAAP